MTLKKTKTMLSQLNVGTYLEKVMLDLPPSLSPEHHKQYLAGVIDTLFDVGLITSEEERAGVYIAYGP